MWIVLLLLLIAPLRGCGQPSEWNGIKVLKSTRADVENILGTPTPDSVAKGAAEYSTKEAKVFVFYSIGGCSAQGNSVWRVPELTVLGITVYPKRKVPFTDLKVDMTKFIERADPEIIHRTEYVNESDGISIAVDTNEGVVESFRYYPKAKDFYLKCKN